jgi:hypothetical protein
MTIARQRLAKHVLERYAVNKNRRPLLRNGFVEHAFPWQRFAKHVGYCEIDTRSRENGYADYNRRIHVLLDWVFCIWFARGYKREQFARRIRERERERERASESVNEWIGQPQELIN